jgi:hypothetical protein
MYKKDSWSGWEICYATVKWNWRKCMIKDGCAQSAWTKAFHFHQAMSWQLKEANKYSVKSGKALSSHSVKYFLIVFFK